MNNGGGGGIHKKKGGYITDEGPGAYFYTFDSLAEYCVSL